jgi:sporulation protein YlmC with PRC-barrel domain
MVLAGRTIPMNSLPEFLSGSENFDLKLYGVEEIPMEVKGTDARRVMSASSLMGDKVVNPEGEDLGKIEEFMIDLDTGCIAYAVLSFGGFLGIGDKLFAIPVQALKLDEDKKCFILNVSKDKLKNASGFDKNDWPDMANAEWGNALYEYYGYEPYWKRNI